MSWSSCGPAASSARRRRSAARRERLVELFNENGMAERIAVGKLSPQEFVEQINRRFGSSITPADVVSWFGPEVGLVFPEVPGLIASLKRRYSLGILSNTFFGHWDCFIATDFARQFDAPMASHLLGYCKPDPRAYRAALTAWARRGGDGLRGRPGRERRGGPGARLQGVSVHDAGQLIQGLQRAGVVSGVG